ncbi:Nuclear export factor [Schizosaccharomyces pombe]|uniref:THP3 homolog C2A9.11c n=1 Tax=Schizosaccharomyces pombe (strain 972 / ATCC 24843) TaxID=284812 RepID=THP3_SCHPO|nr:putative nuclear export factor [Schizosaccharomyces pombe]Q1MTP1.1 RecName: Full=THP3 homolog C2A9.11c [Schizosaccharomyces pombe 972h-]CAB39853.1 nuclear export factor (predicted) [Schizosaccharomyces pombe]|eukprot:NP_596221.1 putative nuclear export factor [Schizosaccharomyces pombe]
MKKEHHSPWPDSLKEFIGRCIQDAEENSQPELEDEVKLLISRQYEMGNIWNVDWSSMNLESLRKLTNAQNTIIEDKKRKVEKPVSGNQFSLLSEEDEVDKKEKRRRRFENGSRSQNNAKSEELKVNPENGAIIGRSTELEKRYLRLTSAPDPDTVRPLPVLKQTLELLKKKWKEEKNYAYICDQFKSLRQDLTVQRIQNEFSVLVYEIHARIALEKGDVGEYNQCQTQLFHLYSFGIPGNTKEFLAYRILYMLFTKNRSEMNSLLANLKEEDKTNAAVTHALEVRSAMATGDYYKFFHLYLVAPNMGGYLMDLFIERERVQAMIMMCKAYRPSLTMEFLANTLAFEEMEDCVNFFRSCNAVYDSKDPNRILMKESTDRFEKCMKKHAVVDIKGQI